MSTLVEAFIAVVGPPIGRFGNCGSMCRVFADGEHVDLTPIDKPSGTINGFALDSLVAYLHSIKGAIESGAAVAALIHCNNAYVCDGLNKWIKGWRARSWMTKDGNPVKHRALWEEASRLLAECNAQMIFQAATSFNEAGSTMMLVEIEAASVAKSPGMYPMPAPPPPKIAGEEITGVWVDESADLDDYLLDRLGVTPPPPPQPSPLLEGQGMW